MIKVKNIMTKEVIAINPGASIADAANLMTSKSVSSLVVAEKGKPIAVISENDVIRGILSKKTKVKDVMSKNFMLISPMTKFSEISRHLRNGKFRRFPVVENDKLIGLITETDIIEATRDFTRFHQIVQEVILTVFGLATAFFLFYFSPLGASFFS